MTVNQGKQELLTHERLTALLNYCAELGIFVWKVSRRGHVHAGDRAGRVVKGYREIKIDRVTYYEHRLAWFYITREWPKFSIDHIDQNKGNNRFSNLREATYSENLFNAKCRTRNVVGLKGVSWSTAARKWRATISAFGKYRTLGCFNSPEEAHAAYCRAARQLHGAFANAEGL